MTDLKSFAAAWKGKPLDQVAAALRKGVEDSNDLWMVPEQGLHSPPTHLIEIQYLGVTAIGFDRLEIARNWLKQANAILLGQLAA